MSSAKKLVKTNKSRNIRSNCTIKNEEQIGSNLKFSQNKSKTELTHLLNTKQINKASGLVLSIHPFWPELPQNQSELFFECTLFLYSVLALFLQYLNLYKTLWWLPKSHWHTSMKFHLINPYLLSCIGLLLGMRVTKCFWNTISERSDELLRSLKGWTLTIFCASEFTIRFFLVTTVLSSFLFSFSKIFSEFHFISFLYFIYPFVVYFVFFHRQALNPRHLFSIKYLPLFLKLCWKDICEAFLLLFHKSLIDIYSLKHLCRNVSSQARGEAKVLLEDFDVRFKCCVFTGLFTAYFSIFIPRALIPEKSVSGDIQYMLIDDIWVMQLCVIVALTGFLLYATYLFPIHYFNLMHECVTHLGYWKKLKVSRIIEETAIDYDVTSDIPSLDGTIVKYCGEYYQAQAYVKTKSVASEPGNEEHLRLYKIAGDPVQLVNYVLIFQFFLLGFQFWALILSTDWQKIVTLVLLMFANYLLLAKVFKDRVIIGRIYKPSNDDQYLISQLRQEYRVSQH